MSEKRQKFHTRTIRLVGPAQMEAAQALLPNVPLDADRPLELVIREESRKRGLDANGYYWLRVGEIADQAWLKGRQFNSDVWHEYMKRSVMPEVITTKDGVQRSKWTELPDGTLAVISTTELERGCFAEYTSLVEVFGAGLGVQYSANPREGAA